jgi:hypothetical protein
LFAAETENGGVTQTTRGVTAALWVVFVVSCGGGGASGPEGTGGAEASAAPGAGGSPGPAGGPAASSPAGAGAAGSVGTPSGAAGAGITGSSASALAASWTFPTLIKTGTTTVSFPTYVSHLLGKTITEPFPTDFACASVANNGTSAGLAHLSASLGVYGAAVTADVSVPARSSMKTCLTPTFDKTALYLLTAPDSATLAVTAEDSSGADIGSSSLTVAIPPVDDIAWLANGIYPKTLKEMAAVYVEPNALDIDKLQRLALQYSAFGVWDSGNGPYQRNPYWRTTTVSSGTLASEIFIVEPSEANLPYVWALQSVTCSSCTGQTVDVAIFTPDQYDSYLQGTSNLATAVWPAQTGGNSGSQVLGAAGQYVIALINSVSNLGDRAVTWTRTVTKEDVVRDVLLATFQALRAASLTYSDITSTFFSDWQHVRRVTQSLETASANCIDGSFVFASVAELLGMQPVLIFKTGHAYMGIRSAPGSSVIWPIETTLVGSTTTTPFQAYETGIVNELSDRAKDPNYQEIDIATLRTRGVTPLVRQ